MQRDRHRAQDAGERYQVLGPPAPLSREGRHQARSSSGHAPLGDAQGAQAALNAPRIRRRVVDVDPMSSLPGLRRGGARGRAITKSRGSRRFTEGIRMT